MYDARLLARVRELPAVRFEGDAFRHQPPSYDPLSGRGARIRGGRWNPPDSFAVLYLGLDRRTVLDEFHRLARRQRRHPEDFLPRVFYRYELILRELVDLRDPAVAQALGIRSAELRSDRLDACRRIGGAVHEVGREGLLAPSEAGEGTVLAVFPDRMTPPSAIVPTRMETWEQAPGAGADS